MYQLNTGDLFRAKFYIIVINKIYREISMGFYFFFFMIFILFILVFGLHYERWSLVQSNPIVFDLLDLFI